MSKVVVLGAAHPHIFDLVATAKAIPGFEVIGLYDADAVRRASAAQKMGVPEMASLQQALASQPALALMGAVPSERLELCITASQAGTAVLVDKPLVLSGQALDTLKKQITQAGTPLSVYYPYRGSPLCNTARASLANGDIGQLVRVMSFGPHKLNPDTRPDWHWSAAGNGGALIDIGSHHFDLCNWVAASSPSCVVAMHANFSQPSHPEFQDFAQAQFRYANGVMGHIEVDWLNPTAMKHFGDTRIWIAGTKGKIEIRIGDESHIKIWNDKVSGADLPLATTVSAKQWDINLMTDLAQGRQGVIPLEDIWTTSRLSLCAFESASSHCQPVEVPKP